jgi:hypothetical protein
MDIESFLRSTNGLIAGFGTLLAGIASILKAVANARQQLSISQGEFSRPALLTSILKMRVFGIGVLLSLAAIGIFAARASLPPPPLNVQLTSAAWDALSKAEYTTAIAKAKECTATFEGQAMREQELLIANNSPLPSTGAVNEDEARIILSRGALNDVAACYLIIGQALEKLNRNSEARNAYKETQKFPYARVWDPRGWFWSPTDEATDRLSRLP